MYLPGMFGTLLGSIFTYHNFLLTDKIKKKDFKNPNEPYNAHGSISNFRPNFHTPVDIDNFLTFDNTQRNKFFNKLNEIRLGIHRIVDYRFSFIDLTENFSNIVKIILIPKNQQHIESWAKRMFHSAVENTNFTWWWEKNLIKKDLKKLPPFFIEGMKIKEYKKYMTLCIKEYSNRKKELENLNIFEFDPIDITNLDKLQVLVDDVCSKLEIGTFIIPRSKIEEFLKINKKFLPKHN